MTDLDELLVRVKSATGQESRENYLINLEIGKALFGWYLHEHKAFGGYDTDWAEWRWPDEKQVRPMPDFIGSIDAALALTERVLPGWVVSDLCQNSRHAGDPWGCTLAIYFGSAPSKNKSATSGYDFPTAPLAILAAVLTALIDQEAATLQALIGAKE